MLKAAYFDADGTLVSFRTHRMPDDAREGLRLLGEAGVKRILCTGRNAEAAAPLIDSGCFDGYVFLNGQLAELDGRVIYSAPVAPDDLAVAVEGARCGAFTLEFVGARDNFLNRVDDFVRCANDAGGMSPIRVRSAEEALCMDVYQFHLYGPPGSEDALVCRARNLTSARWNANFADVYPADGGKVRGMDAINAALGISPEETSAFGDGENDIEMLRRSGIGVAMRNADAAVRRAADFVTASVDEQGILLAVTRLLEGCSSCNR